MFSSCVAINVKCEYWRPQKRFETDRIALQTIFMKQLRGMEGDSEATTLMCKYKVTHRRGGGCRRGGSCRSHGSKDFGLAVA